MIRILQSKEAGRLLTRKAARMAEAEAVVAPILAAVRKRGDAALMEYARKFDGLARKSVRVPEKELLAARQKLTLEFVRAVATAADSVRAFARRQMPAEWMREMKSGLRLGQIVRPLDSMAAYIPAGRYPLPSTLLMTIVPAQVAGVARTYVASPHPSPEILAIAHYLKVTSVFRMGGAQAIAAFAFGTETVPRVDRIVCPGNIYVAAAKKLLAGEVGIDFVAGPTEVVIVSIDGEPRFLASDMLAQAEHDVEASAILITTSRALAEQVAAEIERQFETLSTAAVARPSIDNYGAIVLVDEIAQAVELVNRIAPEHLNLPDEALLC